MGTIEDEIRQMQYELVRWNLRRINLEQGDGESPDLRALVVVYAQIKMRKNRIRALKRQLRKEELN